MVYNRHKKIRKRLPKNYLEIFGRVALVTLIFSSLFFNWPALPFLPKIPKAQAAFPSVATTNTSTAGLFVTAHTVNLPSGITAGDLLIVFFSASGGASTSWPAGWVKIGTSVGGCSNNEEVAYKIADGTEGSTISVSTSPSGVESGHMSYRITNWDGVTPPEIASTTGSSATPNPPSLTPSWGTADTLWIAAMSTQWQTLSVTNNTPTNYTGGMDVDTSGGASCNIASAHRQLNASSENPGTFGISISANWLARTVAVRPAALFTQRAYRFYEDGTESGSSAIDNQDTFITRTVDSDSNLHLRISLQETSTGSGVSTDDWQLQYSKNGGAYTNITTSSSNIKGFNSASLTDQGATTNRGSPDITDPGTGSFVAGVISEDGLVDNHALTGGNYTEDLYSLTVVAADVANNDSFDFRVLYNGATTKMTYSVTPRMIVQKTTPITADQMRHGNWFKGQVEQGAYWAN